MRRPTALLFCFCFLFLLACEAKPPVVDLTEADQKLLSIIKSELNIDAVLKNHPHTIWIYLPTKFDFFKIKLSDEEAASSSEANIIKKLRYIDVNFKEQQFVISYDIGNDSDYMKSYGYSNMYTDDFQKVQRTLMTAIPRAYADVKNQTPDFFVIVFANIDIGLEMSILVSSEDIIRANTDFSFSEEFNQRLIQETLIGSKEIIGDSTGKHLRDHDISWHEFLARQIKYRIEFKYTRSAFPPSDDTIKEILDQVKNTLEPYHFNEYNGFLLRDMFHDTEKYLPAGSF